MGTINPKHSDQKKILYLIAEDQYFYSHRLNLAKEALRAGFEVAVASKFNSDTSRKKEIEALGIKVYPLQHFSRTSINLLKQLNALRELNEIYKSYKPDIAHHVALKPIILGSFIANRNRVPMIVNALGGLGYLFTAPLYKPKKTMMRFLVKRILRWLFNKKNTLVILQNSDDLNLLMQSRVTQPNKTVLIAGSGVDVQAFSETPPPPSPPVVISCVSRMLWDKGIGELVQAALILKKYFHKETKLTKGIKETAENKFIINLFGMPDAENPASIPIKQLEEWHRNGIVHWQKYSKNVVKAYSDCHIAVLPSYREGLPKSLLEAASSGRPIVTTDVPGCREVVKLGHNGILVPPRDSKSLAEALIALIENEALRVQMGKEGRRMVETQFSDKSINMQILDLYKKSL